MVQRPGRAVQQTLMPKPEEPEVKFSLHFAGWVKTAKLLWSAVTFKTRRQCEECAWWLFEHDHVGPSIGQVKFRRTSDQGVMELCYKHGVAWKKKDGK